MKSKRIIDTINSDNPSISNMMVVINEYRRSYGISKPVSMCLKDLPFIESAYDTAREYMLVHAELIEGFDGYLEEGK